MKSMLLIKNCVQVFYGHNRLKQVLMLSLVLTAFMTGCEKPEVIYSSMDRQVYKGSVNSADLIDQIALSIGNGATPHDITIDTFNSE
jgi:hypothetical protein